MDMEIYGTYPYMSNFFAATLRNTLKKINECSISFADMVLKFPAYVGKTTEVISSVLIFQLTTDFTFLYHFIATNLLN